MKKQARKEVTEFEGTLDGIKIPRPEIKFPRQVAPDQRTLALLAAKIAPELSCSNPVEALKKAARLWADAGLMVVQYQFRLALGTLGELTDPNETALSQWGIPKEEPSIVAIGTAPEGKQTAEDASPLLKLVNEKLPPGSHFKTLKNLKEAMGGDFESQPNATHVRLSDVEEFVAFRKKKAAQERQLRRLKVKNEKLEKEVARLERLKMSQKDSE